MGNQFLKDMRIHSAPSEGFVLCFSVLDRVIGVIFPYKKVTFEQRDEGGKVAHLEQRKLRSLRKEWDGIAEEREHGAKF